MRTQYTLGLLWVYGVRRNKFKTYGATPVTRSPSVLLTLTLTYERRENINLFIQINKQTDRHTDRWTDGRTDRHKSFIDMRYYTEQYSKSNKVE